MNPVAPVTNAVGFELVADMAGISVLCVITGENKGKKRENVCQIAGTDPLAANIVSFYAPVRLRRDIPRVGKPRLSLQPHTELEGYPGDRPLLSVSSVQRKYG